MNAISETFDGLRLPSQRRLAAGARPGLLRRIAASLAEQDRDARRRFPDPEEIRLSLHALGRGFDCM